MGVQANQDNSTVPFLRFPNPAAIDTEAIIFQDAGRATPLAPYTLMAKIAATQKWVPFTDETAVNGSAIPAGIYIGSEVTAAQLVAGDVTDAAILIGGNVTIDTSLLVIENSKLLTTVITVGTTLLITVADYLAMVGIFTEGTVAISGFENA